MLRPLLASILLLVASCAAPRPVHFSSTPAGARILIEGQDTGFVTPCLIDVVDGPPRTVAFQLPGYVTENRTIVFQKRKELVFWRESSAHYNTWNFPLFLGAEDFFIFEKNLSGESPGRLYVRLRREADR